MNRRLIFWSNGLVLKPFPDDDKPAVLNMLFKSNTVDLSIGTIKSIRSFQRFDQRLCPDH